MFWKEEHGHAAEASRKSRHGTDCDQTHTHCRLQSSADANVLLEVIKMG